jgi:anti-anti-sigma regulatory factor
MMRAARGSNTLTIDFRPAEYIDSAILQALVEMYSALSRRNGRIRILVVEGGHPEYALKTVGFDTLMEINSESYPGKA